MPTERHSGTDTNKSTVFVVLLLILVAIQYQHVFSFCSVERVPMEVYCRVVFRASTTVPVPVEGYCRFQGKYDSASGGVLSCCFQG